MSDINKIRKFLKKADYNKVTEYDNGFLVTIPGERKIVDLYIFIKRSTITIRSKGLKMSGGDMEKLYKHLLRLNNTSLLAKWGIDEKGAIFVGHDRLLKDLDFSEFYAAVQLVMGFYDEQMDELKKLV